MPKVPEMARCVSRCVTHAPFLKGSDDRALQPNHNQGLDEDEPT